MVTPVTYNAPALGAAHRWKVLGVGVAANASFSAALASIPTTAVWMRSGYYLNSPEQWSARADARRAWPGRGAD